MIPEQQKKWDIICFSTLFFSYVCKVDQGDRLPSRFRILKLVLPMKDEERLIRALNELADAQEYKNPSNALQVHVDEED